MPSGLRVSPLLLQRSLVDQVCLAGDFRKLAFLLLPLAHCQ
jgi:hypothetical protein